MMNNLTIAKDVRLELLTSVILLSDLNNDKFLDLTENKYSKKIKSHFKEFSFHPAVKNFPEMWRQGLSWDSIPNLAVYLNEQICPVVPFTNTPEFVNRFGKSVSCLNEYCNDLKNFYEISNFKSFYKKSDNFSSEFILELQEKINEIPVIEILENYIHLKLPQQNVIFSNLLRSFYGVWNHFQPKQIYCFLSRYWLKVAKQNKSLDRILFSSIWHEFLHSVINPLSDKLFDNSAEIEGEDLERYCQLNESIIWAITLRLLIKTKILNPNNCDWYFRNAERNRAPKTKVMHKLLLKYEDQQNRFKNITEFYPVLLEKFGDKFEI